MRRRELNVRARTAPWDFHDNAQIASIVVTGNQVDIDAGRLATSRSTNDEVKASAELMISDHTAGTFDSKNIQADKSWKFATRKTADFDYICTFHPAMKARLRVKS